MLIQSIAATAALGLAVTGAQSALISFAAGSNPNDPTLVSQFDAGSKITSILDRGPTMLNLLTHPDDGSASPVTSPVALLLTFSMTHITSNQIMPGLWAHTFSVSGSFEFRDQVTDDLLYRGTAGESGGVFVGLGTATKINSGGIGDFNTTYDIGPAGEAIVGFGGTQLPGDFGFTLTDINNGAGATLIFENGSVVGIEDFFAHSSFSGSFIPTPGALALAMMSGVMAIRRRRNV